MVYNIRKRLGKGIKDYGAIYSGREDSNTQTAQAYFRKGARGNAGSIHFNCISVGERQERA